MRKRIVALLLSACLILNTSSVAFATDVDQADGGTTVETEAADDEENENVSEEGAVPDNVVPEESNVSDAELEAEVRDMMNNGQAFTGVVTGVDADGNVYEIIDSDSGVVEDDGIAVQSVYSDRIVNFRANGAGVAVTDVTEYVEAGTGAAGYVYGAYGADAAYLGTTSDGMVKFMMSGVVGLVSPYKVQVLDRSNANVKSYSSYYANGTDLIHNICTNMAKADGTNAINVGKQPSYLTTGTTYYSYDGHYFYTSYNTMIDDYVAGHRRNSVNSQNPYYNYFQYLPLRGRSNYSQDEMQSMINVKTSSSSKMYNTGSVFAQNQNAYGVNALLMAATAANESAWGRSSIALNKNNLFGWNAVDSSPGQSANYFSSVSQCIKDFAGTYMSKQYLRAGWTYYHGGFLGDKASGINVSYASDPYWGEKIAAIAWALDKANGQKDQFVYNIGIKDTLTTDHLEVSVCKEASASSTVLYTTKSSSNYAFIILGENGDFYKVISDPVLNSSRTSIDTSSGVHTGTAMYAYVKKSYVDKVLDGNGGSDYVLPDDYLIKYNTHIQTYGWNSERADGYTSGTEGLSKRMEAIRISLGETGYSGSVEYTTHVQTYGWLDWVKDGELSGTEGASKRVEAIQIKLTGEVAEHYDIYYRVHAQTHGWLDWAKNGAMAGTEGGSKRLEAIQICMVAKGSAAPGATAQPFVSHILKYRSHVQTFGWQDYLVEPALSGTEGLSKRLEAVQILSTQNKYNSDIEYQVHVQTYGWQNWKSSGELAGTTGLSKRLEAIRIRLKGTLAERYDVYYRVHCQTYGWLDWAKNGEMAGTSGLSKRMECYQVVLVEKGAEAPGKTQTPCIEK